MKVDKKFRSILFDYNKYQSEAQEVYEAATKQRKFHTGETQWDGVNAVGRPKQVINETFNANMRLIGQLQRMNVGMQITAESDEATEKDALMLQNLYRADSQSDKGVIGKNNAIAEGIAGGIGAFKWVQEYVNPHDPTDDRQCLRRVPIMGADESVVFGASSDMMKTDCTQSFHLFKTNKQDIDDEYGVNASSFGGVRNYDSTSFTGIQTSKDITLAHYYEVVTKRCHDVILLVNGTPVEYKRIVGEGKFKTNLDGAPELSSKELRQAVDNGIAQVINERKYEKKCVEYNLLHGGGFLIKGQKTSFKRQPIIPFYCYYMVIEGAEYFFGRTKLLEDTQRGINYYASALTEIMSEKQTQTPIFHPDHIKRHQSRWNTKHTKRPEFLMLDNDSNNQPWTGAALQPPQMSQSMAQYGVTMFQSMENIKGSGQSTVKANTSGEAVALVNERNDDQYFPIVVNLEEAEKASCLCWLDAAQDIYFSESRSISGRTEDGKRIEITTMQQGQNAAGELGNYKNSAMGVYGVSAKAGQSFESRQEAQQAAIRESMSVQAQGSLTYEALGLSLMDTMHGEGLEDAKQLARIQMIKMQLANGITPEPRDDNDQMLIQMVMQQMQQPQEPSAEDKLAQAEMEKAAAEMAKVQQREAQAQRDFHLALIDRKLQEQKNIVEAVKVDAEIQNIQFDTESKRLDNQSKQVDNLIKLNQPIQQ
ncbi:MAG: hypothetical protein HRU48_22790 [Vibrio sp.]|uniref:portal protein n=1 Tax=Vibrio sp. TaxID=678 RepID=UPI001ED1FE50|nr:portal protein [Vibrio sp.]NRB70139.1 hypothetical protein [Vibrio sp.]